MTLFPFKKGWNKGTFGNELSKFDSERGSGFENHVTWLKAGGFVNVVSRNDPKNGYFYHSGSWSIGKTIEPGSPS